MSNITIEPHRLVGEILPPPDKSISHRAVIVGSLAQGETQIRNLSVCADCLRTIGAFRKMGISITKKKGVFIIQGQGLHGLRKPKGKLYMGNSGTSLRLILGVLAGQKFKCTLTGDASLSRRPMKRVTEPLSLMGAKIGGKSNAEFAPLTIQGQNLKPICYTTPVASAQVKSAILLAANYACGKTEVREPAQSRDHTERMLKKFGADISVSDRAVFLNGGRDLCNTEIEVPGDISSASFFLVGACIIRGSQVTVRSVGLNPTRSAFLNILQQMGAKLCWKYKQGPMQKADNFEEPTGEISAKFSHLKAITIKPEQISHLIDELPILMVAATQAEGTTIIQGAQELRVKETDRIKAMVSNLGKMGAEIENIDDDIIIRGPVKLVANTVNSFSDHRTAMSMAIAGLLAQGRTIIKNVDCVDISFPGFFQVLTQLTNS